MKTGIEAKMCDIRGFPGGAGGLESVCQCRRHKRHVFHPWVRNISQRRKRQPGSVFLPGTSHGLKPVPLPKGIMEKIVR